MKAHPKDAELLRRAIHRWKDLGLLTEEKAEQLEDSITEIPFNWHQITRLAFSIALICGLVSFIYLLADKLLLELFYKIINAPYPLLSALLALCAAGTYFMGWRRTRRREQVYSTEAIMLAAGAMAGAALFFLGRSISEEMAHYSLLFLAGAGIWLILGRALPSPSTWVVGVLCLLAWFGTETAYIGGDDPYWLGMNLPLRYFLFSFLLLAAAVWLGRSYWPAFFPDSLRFIAYLVLFSALWLLSLFGNFGDWDAWRAASGWRFAGWSLLLALLSALAVWFGSRQKDNLLRGLGIFFFLLNLYTKYFEHAWDRMHGALFFLILALSFWFIGRRAEKLWEITRT